MRYQVGPSRRRFLQTTAGASLALGIDAALPDFLSQAAQPATDGNDRILVVVQLSGGNDGLNTVIPYADDAYRSARPTLAMGKSEVLTIDDRLGLHPALRGLHDLLEDGRLTIVQGVGYENPNRSHFESMDIWHTCRRKSELRSDGWLGRFLDRYAADAGGDVPALHLGRRQQPVALAADHVRAPSVTSLDEFQLSSGNREALRELIDALARQPTASADNDLLSFVQSSTSTAIVASKRVTEAGGSYETEVAYPDTELAKKLRTVAQLIDAGLTTRIYYVELDGFDTHAKQAQAHNGLLKEWGDAVSTFVQDLSDHEHAQRVCVMTFSEFGRRVAENASGGTDHGAAAPMFLCGGKIHPGVVGAMPSLTDLQDGDLKHSIDFRQVYAAVLRDWLKCDATTILGAEYSPLPLFSS